MFAVVCARFSFSHVTLLLFRESLLAYAGLAQNHSHGFQAAFQPWALLCLRRRAIVAGRYLGARIQHSGRCAYELLMKSRIGSNRFHDGTGCRRRALSRGDVFAAISTVIVSIASAILAFSRQWNPPRSSPARVASSIIVTGRFFGLLTDPNLLELGDFSPGFSFLLLVGITFTYRPRAHPARVRQHSCILDTIPS